MYFDMHTHAAAPANSQTIAVRNVIIGRDTAPTDGSYYTAGIHPWYISDLEQQLLALETPFTYNPYVLGLGECGLDKICQTPFSLQMQAFERQIAISERFDKPLIIHCVRAYDEVLRLRQISGTRQRWLIHGFRKGLILAEQLLAAGFDLSFGADLLRLQPDHVIKNIPIERLHLKTDDSGATIEQIYSAAAEILQMPEPELMRQMQTNWSDFFQILF
jgi:TatD DNase family protein